VTLQNHLALAGEEASHSQRLELAKTTYLSRILLNLAGQRLINFIDTKTLHFYLSCENLCADGFSHIVCSLFSQASTATYCILE
jgi:hypothetical protein